jgi:hypothetical protein
MISPENRARLRRSAPIRAQIRVLDAQRDGNRDRLLITGRYYRVFSGYRFGALPGRTVRLAIPLATADAMGVAKLGDAPLCDPDYLDGARWLEVYLEKDGESWSLVYGQMLVIAHPSLRPVYR